MNQLFEVKVSYERQADELGARKISEVYLINALSFTEAEARATKEIQPYAFAGELTIDSCRKRRIAEIIESADTQDDRWFEARVSFITLDEKSGTERKTPVTMLIQSDTLPNALSCLETELGKQLGSYEVNIIKETSILEYYKYEPQN